MKNDIKCTRCFKKKPLSDFFRSKSRITKKCLECREYFRKRRLEKKDKRSALVATELKIKSMSGLKSIFIPEMNLTVFVSPDKDIQQVKDRYLALRNLNYKKF